MISQGPAWAWECRLLKEGNLALELWGLNYPVVTMIGNHEKMMVEWVFDGIYIPLWIWVNFITTSLDQTLGIHGYRGIIHIHGRKIQVSE